MPSILLHLDKEMAKRLKKAAPPRQRSRFIRLAIQRALMSIDEVETRKAYERQPDDVADAWFDPRTWSTESWADLAPKKKRTRR